MLLLLLLIIIVNIIFTTIYYYYLFLLSLILFLFTLSILLLLLSFIIIIIIALFYLSKIFANRGNRENRFVPLVYCSSNFHTNSLSFVCIHFIILFPRRLKKVISIALSLFRGQSHFFFFV